MVSEPPPPARTSLRARLPLLAGLFLATLFGLWPLRDGLTTGRLPGAGPDVISTLWGNWWGARTGLGAAFGTFTDLANHPYGLHGQVLSPSSALVFALTRDLLGVGGASAACILVQALGIALLTAWVAHLAGAGRAGVVAAAAVVLAGRSLLFAAGLGSVVAIAALPVPLGLGALILVLRPHGGRWPAVLLATAIAGQALENPYLAPILPAVGAVVLVARWHHLGARPRHRLLGAVLGGSLVVALIAVLFRTTANPDYPVEQAATVATIGPLAFDVVDLPWARATPGALLWPGTLRWATSSFDARSATGGWYLGLVGVALALGALALDRRRALPFGLLLGACVLLSFGSLLGGVGMPFIYLNALMDAVARPLTQPTRFLAPAVVALGVLGGLMVDRLVRTAPRGRTLAAAAVCLVGLDGAWFGAGQLRMPTTPLPALACAGELADGGVLLWAPDADDIWANEMLLYQVQHQQPAVHGGLDSWAPGSPDAIAALRAAGWWVRAAGPIDTARLVALGYRWGVVLPDTVKAEARWLERQFPGPAFPCGDLVVYDLGSPRPDRSGVGAAPRHGQRHHQPGPTLSAGRRRP